MRSRGSRARPVWNGSSIRNDTLLGSLLATKSSGYIFIQRSPPMRGRRHCATDSREDRLSSRLDFGDRFSCYQQIEGSAKHCHSNSILISLLEFAISGRYGKCLYGRDEPLVLASKGDFGHTFLYKGSRPSHILVKRVRSCHPGLPTVRNV